MRIGVHPFNLHLRLAQHWPGAFSELDPVFVPYGEGRDTGRLLVEGLIDVGGTGSTPAVLAQAEGLGVTYVAASAPRPANGAILVRAGGALRTVGDLRGKRVALVEGSFHTYLLARALEGEGLALTDIETLEPPNEDVLAMLRDGRIDAWIAMSPRLESAEREPDLRVIARCGETIPNRSVFWTTRARGLSAKAISALADGLARVGREVSADPRLAAERLVAGGAREASVDEWERVLRGRSFAVFPADAQLLAEQDEEAATLQRHGYLKKV